MSRRVFFSVFNVLSLMAAYVQFGMKADALYEETKGRNQLAYVLLSTTSRIFPLFVPL